MKREDKIFSNNQTLCEGDKDPVSVNKAKYLMKKSAEEAWIFLMGKDSLKDFELWWNDTTI